MACQLTTCYVGFSSVMSPLLTWPTGIAFSPSADSPIATGPASTVPYPTSASSHFLSAAWLNPVALQVDFGDSSRIYYLIPVLHLHRDSASLSASLICLSARPLWSSLNSAAGFLILCSYSVTYYIQCAGLNENVSYRLMYLKIPSRRAVWEGLGGMILQEEVCQWRSYFMFHNFDPYPVSSFSLPPTDS